MNKTICAIALAGLAGLVATASAQEAYGTYDSFVSTEIDPARWLLGERVRQIRSGALNLVMREHGDQVGDTGRRNTNWSVGFDEPARITQIRALVAIDSYDVPQCATSADYTGVQARLIGSFFNAGAPAAGSQLNDVLAFARLTRRSNSPDPAGTVKVEAFVVQCTSADCSSSAVLGSADLGTATLGALVRLQVEWDQVAKNFVFRRDTLPPVSVAYAVSDAAPPGAPSKSLQIRTEIANCQSGARGTAMVNARFDSVQVHASGSP